MYDCWNLHHKGPPPCTVETIVTQSAIMDMKNTLVDACSTYNDLKVFNVEAAYLARFLYRFKRLFRQDKGIQLLTKVKQALERFHKERAIGPIKRLLSCFPVKIPPDGRQAHLPTQQLLQWVLLRLLSNAKLFVRLTDLCKDAGRYIYGRLYMGWNTTNLIFALAINSRIFTCSKYMLIKTIEWYDRLRPNLSNLIETAHFVGHYEFPQKMEDFIGYIDLRPPTKKADIDKIFELIDLTRGDENDEDDDVVLVNEIINAADSDSEIEAANDDIIVEEEIIENKGKKRFGDDVAVLYDQTKKLAPSFAALTTVEDLGEPVQKKRHLSGRQRKRMRGQNLRMMQMQQSGKISRKKLINPFAQRATKVARAKDVGLRRRYKS